MARTLELLKNPDGTRYGFELNSTSQLLLTRNGSTLLNLVTDRVGSAGFTVGAEASNIITVAVQLKDLIGNDMAVRANVFAYLSDDSAGDSLIATAPDGGVVVGTDGLLIPQVADKAFRLTSEADGDIDVAITHAADAKTCYLVVALPTGKLAVSGAITFA